MLPAKIRVKVLSEAAGYISVSRVAQRDFTLAELIETFVPITGTDAVRVRQILKAGTIVIGDYRFRWDSLEAEEPEVNGLLDALPHSEPSRRFDVQKASIVRFRRGEHGMEFTQEGISRKPLFAKRGFSEELVDSFGAQVGYAHYSHADKADIFAVDLDERGRETLEGLLPLLKPKNVAARLQALRPDRIEWLLRR